MKVLFVSFHYCIRPSYSFCVIFLLLYYRILTLPLLRAVPSLSVLVVAVVAAAVGVEALPLLLLAALPLLRQRRRRRRRRRSLRRPSLAPAVSSVTMTSKHANEGEFRERRCMRGTNANFIRSHFETILSLAESCDIQCLDRIHRGLYNHEGHGVGATSQ